MARTLTVLFAGIGLMVTAVLGLYFQFRNPDMTEMRFLIEYWPLSVIAIACAAAIHWATSRRR